VQAEISEAIGLSTEAHEPRQVPDLRELPSTPINELMTGGLAYSKAAYGDARQLTI
jgi:hypothetical protein